MKLRERALYATSALLYTGPLYAGLAGYGFETIPLFAFLFMLWLHVVRPGDWPETREDWRSPRSLAWPLLILSVQLVVVGACLAIGRGAGGLTGLAPPLPFVFTFFVSFLGIALARILKRHPGKREVRIPGEEFGIGSGILDVGNPTRKGKRDEEAFVEATMSMLADLRPADATAAGLNEILTAVEANGMAAPVLEALAAVPAGKPTATRARTLLALRPGVARTLLGQGRIGRAVEDALASKDRELLRDTADAARELLASLPDLEEELPSVARINFTADEAVTEAPAATNSLRGLARELERLRRA